MSRPDISKVRKAKANASEYLDLVHALARIHSDFLDELLDDGANPDEHVWKHLGDRVLFEEGDFPYTALGAVIASISVYLAATANLDSDELGAALDGLVDAVDELQEISVDWKPSRHALH